MNYSSHVLSYSARTARKIEGGGVTPIPAVVQCHLSADSWAEVGDRVERALLQRIEFKKWGEINFKQIEK